MDIRNPKYNAAGGVDCEIAHPQLGWIPFTASPDDAEAHGREIYALAEAMGPIEYVQPVLTKADLLALLADLRWRKETGGITVGGMFVATDDRSKLLLQGARTAADADPDHVEGWKTSNGEWVDLDASTIIALSNAVRSHVSACFALERDIATQIEAETITTREQVEAAFAVEPQT